MQNDAQRITPNIWCTRNAEEVGRFYAEIFEGATCVVESRYPTEGLPEFQREFAGEPLTVAVTIAGTRLVLINAGDEFSPNPSISLMLNFDPLIFSGDEDAARASLDELWGSLSEGGFALMPLGEYPFSKHYGWVQDRYGVSWQLMLTDPVGDPRPFLMPSLLYGGAAQNRAREAVDHYLSVFSAAGIEAELGARVLYPAAQGPVTTESVMFSDFRVDDQWIVAMDSGVPQQFSFDCGVSLEVACRDQRQIDLLWEGLSAVPDAEVCGWLADLAGVSWQIVPENIGELMERPGAYQKLMEMKRIVVSEF